jgi:hypothetical protein
MRASLLRSVFLALALAAALAGCSAGPLEDALPQSMGGLPGDTPPPPKVPYQFPAVHDMPPPRATQPLTDEQQWKLEQDLTALRTRQEGRTGDKAAATPAKSKPSKKKAKRKPPARDAKNAGANTNP